MKSADKDVIRCRHCGGWMLRVIGCRLCAVNTTLK